jgi:tetratricopeptide (TPR) repeat protein
MILARTLRTGAIALTVLMLAASARASGGGGGGDEEEANLHKSSEYKQGVQAIKAKDFGAGIEWMTKAIAADPKDADAYNYLGFSQRKLGRIDEALQSYTHALELDPDHRGAHEYLGEAYLEMNQLAEAQKHLAVLDKLCWLPCEQFSDLKKAIETYEKTHQG